jgi:hypothetical protein
MHTAARFAATLAFHVCHLAAQPLADPMVLRQRLEDKLASRFLSGAVWHTDLEEAKRAAARAGKLILAHCTRSFLPCGTSIRCEREVLSSPDFVALAERVVLYCHVTARLDPAHDRFLFDARGSGWPHHAVLDATGRLLGTHESYRDKSVLELGRLVDVAEGYLRMEAETERQLAAARLRLLVAGLEAGALDLREARRLLAGCGPLPAAEADRVHGLVADLEVAEVLRRFDRFDERVHAAAGAELHAMWRAGKRPAARNAVRDFWGGILLHLEREQKPDLALYREGLAALERLLGGSRGYSAFLDDRRKALAALEAAQTGGGTLRD